MTFSYILAGWEGSAHDGLVLSDALDKSFPILQGKYYLGDAGYGLKRYLLTPYRGVRYHLKEWARGILLYESQFLQLNSDLEMRKNCLTYGTPPYET